MAIAAELGYSSAEEYSLLIVGPNDLPRIWPVVTDWIESVAESSRGKLTTEDLAYLIVAEKMQLWVVREQGELRGVVITELVEFPKQRVARIVGCVGEGLHSWYHLIDDIERWAARHNCGAMQHIARKGYTKLLEPLGYTCTHVVLEKHIGGFND